MSQYYSPKMASDGSFTFWQDGEPPVEPRPFNPRTKLYDREGNLTGAQIGARREGGSRYPSGKLELRPYPGPATRGNPFLARMDRAAGQPAGKLELRPYPGGAARGNPFLSRMDRVAASRADGTFDAKRAAYNAGNSGSHMDERGDIAPRAAGTGGQDGAGATPGTGGRLQEWNGGMRWVTDADRARYKEHDAQVQQGNQARTTGNMAEAALNHMRGSDAQGLGGLLGKLPGAFNAAYGQFKREQEPQSSQGTINGKWSQESFYNAAREQKTDNAYFKYDPVLKTAVPREYARPAAAGTPATPAAPAAGAPAGVGAPKAGPPAPPSPAPGMRPGPGAAAPPPAQAAAKPAAGPMTQPGGGGSAPAPATVTRPSPPAGSSMPASAPAPAPAPASSPPPGPAPAGGGAGPAAAAQPVSLGGGGGIGGGGGGGLAATVEKKPAGGGRSRLG